MPATTRGRKRDKPRMVTINDVLGYGFMQTDISSATGVTDADLTGTLGQVDISTATPPIPVIWGANAPKPTRMTKKTGSTTGIRRISAFASHDRVASARNQSWKVSKQGRMATPSKTATNQTVGVELGSVVYIFSMNSADFGAFGADLGLKSTFTATDVKRMVRGCSTPQPGSATKELTGGTTFTSFYDPTKLDSLLAAGWKNITTAIL